MTQQDYNEIEEEITEWLTQEEDLDISKFDYHPDGENTMKFILKRFSELKAEYQELMKDKESNAKAMEDILIRAEMLMSGLVLFEFEE